MQDHYLLQAVANVTGSEGLQLLESSLESCHYDRYTFRRCGEQLTRELADGWESLRAAIQRAEDVFETPRLPSSPLLQQSLRQAVAHASKLLAEVVALFASCIPTVFSAGGKRRVRPHTLCQQREGVDHFFHEVQRNQRSIRLVPEMKAALHEIDLSLASASLYETKMLLSADLAEHKSNGDAFRVTMSPLFVQFGGSSVTDPLHAVSWHAE